MSEPPVQIMEALDMLHVTLARGCQRTGPFWQTVKGGTVKVQWMERLGAYRFTLDMLPPLPFPEVVE